MHLILGKPPYVASVLFENAPPLWGVRNKNLRACGRSADPMVSSAIPTQRAGSATKGSLDVSGDELTRRLKFATSCPLSHTQAGDGRPLYRQLSWCNQAALHSIHAWPGWACLGHVGQILQEQGSLFVVVWGASGGPLVLEMHISSSAVHEPLFL